MKYLIILIILWAPYFNASGASFLFDSRFDFIDVDNDSTKSGVPSYSGFEATDIRLDIQGSVQKAYEYRFRYNFRKSAVNDIYDKSPSSVEYAYIQKNINPRFNIQMGKVAVLIGSFEYDYLSTDVYSYSLVNDDLPVFELGAVFSYSLTPGHTLKAQVMNSNSRLDGVTPTQNKAQKKPGNSVVWYGGFLENRIKTIWSYTQLPIVNSSFNVELMALGQQMQINKYTLDLDYLISKNTATDTRNTSVVAQLKLNNPKWRPLFKAFSDKNEVNNNVVYKGLGTAVAFEYYPDKSSKNRLHISYTNYKKDFESNLSQDNIVSKIFFGTKFSIDLLN
jgi:hypothetical protein